MTETLFKLGLVPYFTQQLAELGGELTQLGRVSAVQRTKTTVLCETGELVVELAPSVRDGDAIERPTVGDWVLLDPTMSRIVQVLARKTLFKRLAAGENSDIQPIAANIDILFIVSSCNEEFKLSRLERYLALCAEAGAMPVIVLTKADLVDDPSEYVALARQAQAGVAVELINGLDADTLSGVRAWIGKTDTIALVGSSGVGKSTLLNTLAGTELAATSGIREQDRKGRHTTTFRELHPLASGGNVIDVPGMRELKVADVEHSLTTVFDDIEQLAKHCRFADCHHQNEPGCAVLKEVADGNLAQRRLDNYHKLLRENAHATATLAEKRAQGRDFAKMVKTVKRVKQNKHRGDDY
ncbi:ribosome small subunit-dependent GTPase A [Colwellia sp. MEBiC06753]